MSNENPIPAAVLALLKQPWQRNANYSAFARNYEKRRADPSYYIHQLGDSGLGSSAFTTAELVALMEANVLDDDLVKEHPDSIAVNEHAEHAISDFCSAVYREWDRLSERLIAVSSGSPLPTDN